MKSASTHGLRGLGMLGLILVVACGGSKGASDGGGEECSGDASCAGPDGAPDGSPDACTAGCTDAAACNGDGVCDRPGETVDNCPIDCAGAPTYVGEGNGAFLNVPFEAQSGAFRASFDARTPANDALTALSQGPVTNFPELSVIARFNPDGQLDAFDSDAYRADVAQAYEYDVDYHFVVTVNMELQRYQVQVELPGGEPVALAAAFGFRRAATSLDHLVLWSLAAPHTVSGFQIEPLTDPPGCVADQICDPLWESPASCAADCATAGPGWLEVPPVLESPIVVTNYDDYGTGPVRQVDGQGGDLLLLAHAPAGEPVVLRNTTVAAVNFRRLHIRGLDLEFDDPSSTATRSLLIRTTPSTPYPLTEEVFIEGLRIHHNFVMDNLDAIATHRLGDPTQPVRRFVIQNSRITGVGVPGIADTPGYHPDCLQFQGQVEVEHVYLQRSTLNSMYQGVFAPWNQNTVAARTPAWHLREASISSEDSDTNGLFTIQDDGFSAADYPVTTIDNLYLNHTKIHRYIMGPVEIHTDPSAPPDAPFSFRPEVRITGTPTPGLPTSEFAPRDQVGIYYRSPHTP